MKLVLLMAKRMKDVWDEWGIELLVTVSCVMHMVLTLFGGRRKRMQSNQIIVRFIIWFAYLMSNYVVTVIIGKLSLIPVGDSTREITDSELRGLLAPLLLVQLGSRDAITAYSIEDNRLGQRQFLNLMAQLCAVLWILARCWNSSVISYLYLPLLLAGFIKYGENVWVLFTSLSEGSGIRKSDLVHLANIGKIFKIVPKDIPDLGIILKAYYRFVCLKPHIDNWIYRPYYQSFLEFEEPFDKSFLDLQSIDNYLAEDIFKITDFELSFMYDTLYTKAPIIYTRMGFVLRLISSLSLISTLIVFAFMFKDAFIFYPNAGFICVVFGVILTLDAYQIYMLSISDWAIIEMTKHGKKPIVEWFLRKLAPQSSKWKKWSNTLGQFNLESYGRRYNRRYSSRILKFRDLDMEIRNVFFTSKIVGIPLELKELIINGIEDFEQENNESKPIGNDDEWGVKGNAITIRSSNLDFTKWIDERDFVQQIIIGHLATERIYGKDFPGHDSNREAKRASLLSNYLMYILATQSHILCITTSKILFRYACKQLAKSMKGKVTNERTACCKLFKEKKNKHAMVTKNWDVLGDVERLTEYLLKKDDRWNFICSMWVKMLCLVATNCPTDCHCEQLRRGGEIVTHVWLILRHKKQTPKKGSFRDQSRKDKAVACSTSNK